MKNYKAPELEIVKFSHEDIVTASSFLDALVIGNSTANGEYNYEAADGSKTKYSRFGQ